MKISNHHRHRWTIPFLLLVLSFAAPSARPADLQIRDKTLVAWVAPANLNQRGGSALTLDDTRSHFDGIVFGEISPSRWMPGSDFYRRTHREQADWPAETAAPTAMVQIALIYQDRQITVYRDGQPYAKYTMPSPPQSFGSEAVAVLGKRHLEQQDNAQFLGAIDDARIYDLALTAPQIAALKPNQPSDPKPVAWWDFENGKAADRMQHFVATTLFGNARIADGRLHLDAPGDWLLATRTMPDTKAPSPDPTARALREHLLADPHRPGYHFVTPEGSCMPFDPNGALFWKGRYHLFYIFQDQRGHNWGHVSSTDLFHWRHHPTGLISGMFSGNAFINRDGRPTICYHQVGQGNAMAVARDDDLNQWQKLDSNPITPKTQPGDPNHDKYRSWDPFGWLEGDTYYAIFGGERPGLVKAPSLGGEWRYVGDFLANTVPGVALNEDVSCADFFRLGDRYMLLCISHRLGARYYLGDWLNEQFHPTFHEKMSWVDHLFFAPESLLDDRGRRIMWSWVFDRPGFQTRTDYGWSGTMSLPRVLSLGPDGRLCQNPPEEIQRLRHNPKQWANLRLNPDSDRPLEGIAGNSLELELVANIGDAKQLGLAICRSPDGQEQTRIFYDATDHQLKVDTTRASLKEDPRNVEAGPFALDPGQPLTLRVFVDKSIVEVFANGRQAVTRRMYPSRPDSLGVALFATGGPATLTSLQAWDLEPSNPF